MAFPSSNGLQPKNPIASGRWGFVLLLVVLLCGCTAANNGGRCGKSESSLRTLAPDDPGPWLHQARRWCWLGDYLKARECLDRATEAIQLYRPGVHSWDKKTMQRRLALAQAWQSYDRGEWREGLRWIRAARKIDPGNAAVQRIFGLLAGHAGLRSEALEVADDLGRRDPGDPAISWVEAAYRVSVRQYRQAFNLVMTLHPNREHEAECWREMGEIAEHLEEYSRSNNWYEESAHALPLKSVACVRRRIHSRLKPGTGSQKIWLNRNRYYVTGSLSAYTSLAFERFGGAASPRDRDFWAGQVINATGTLLRKNMDRNWAYRTRGLVFAEQGEVNRGLKDLKRAGKFFRERGSRDGVLEAALGHLLLKKENHAAALPHLRRAVEWNSGDAGAWQDLGLALIMDGDSAQAESALTRALKLDPASATAWYNRGLLYFHRQDFSRAQTDLEAAARLAPQNAEVIKLLQKTRTLQRRENH